MNILTRIRIILFAVMVFGAFANFAHNEWGNIVILLSQLALAITFYWKAASVLMVQIKEGREKFLAITRFIYAFIIAVYPAYLIFFRPETEMPIVVYIFGVMGLGALLLLSQIVQRIRKVANKEEFSVIYENIFLALVFQCMCNRNLAMPGVAPVIILSCLFLLPHYIASTVRFFRKNKKDGSTIITVLTIGSTAGIIFGVSLNFKIMHWPGASIMFWVAAVLTLVLIGAAVKWKYIYKERQINILQALKIPTNQIVLVYLTCGILSFYRFFIGFGIAPDFYNNRFPANFYALRNIGTRESNDAAEICAENYRVFIYESEKNGFGK